MKNKKILWTIVLFVAAYGAVALLGFITRPKQTVDIAPDTIKEVIKEVVLKKPACPNTSGYFTELKNAGQIVVLAKNLNSYGVDGQLINIKRAVVKSVGSGSQIACGYLYIKAHVAGRALQQEWEHPYIKPDEFGGHLIMDNAVINRGENGVTELLFNLSSIKYTEVLSGEARKADWSALLNVSDKTRFAVALNTTDQAGVIDEVSIVYQCWNPETGQTTHDCRLITE